VTLGKLFREASERIAGGETDIHGMVSEYTGRVLSDESMTRSAVHQLVEKRLKDLLSSYLKPSGKTARVPAGQMSWLAMDPTLAVSRMRSYIKSAISMKARADKHAIILGYVDGSGLEPSEFATFGELCLAASVPEEMVASLAA